MVALDAEAFLKRAFHAGGGWRWTLWQGGSRIKTRNPKKSIRGIYFSIHASMFVGAVTAQYHIGNTEKACISLISFVSGLLSLGLLCI